MLKPVLRVAEAGGRTVDDPTKQVLHDLLSEMREALPWTPMPFQ
ncbi:hypothetical protein [Streptomyces sp. XH2]